MISRYLSFVVSGVLDSCYWELWWWKVVFFGLVCFWLLGMDDAQIPQIPPYVAVILHCSCFRPSWGSFVLVMWVRFEGTMIMLWGWDAYSLSNFSCLDEALNLLLCSKQLETFLRLWIYGRKMCLFRYCFSEYFTTFLPQCRNYLWSPTSSFADILHLNPSGVDVAVKSNRGSNSGRIVLYAPKFGREDM